MSRFESLGTKSGPWWEPGPQDFDFWPLGPFPGRTQVVWHTAQSPDCTTVSAYAGPTLPQPFMRGRQGQGMAPKAPRYKSRILVRGPSGVLTPGGPQPRICSNRVCPLQLPENCMILNLGAKRGLGPLDPQVEPIRTPLHSF